MARRRGGCLHGPLCVHLAACLPGGRVPPVSFSRSSLCAPATHRGPRASTLLATPLLPIPPSHLPPCPTQRPMLAWGLLWQVLGICCFPPAATLLCPAVLLRPPGPLPGPLAGPLPGPLPRHLPVHLPGPLPGATCLVPPVFKDAPVLHLICPMSVLQPLPSPRAPPWHGPAHEPSLPMSGFIGVAWGRGRRHWVQERARA